MSRSASDSSSTPVRGEVAIVGLACTYPGARRMAQFWQNIVNKFDAIADVDPEHWDPDVFFDPDANAEDRLYSKKGGWLPTTFSFNPLSFGIPPATVSDSEPDQFLLLRCAFEALDDAGYLKRDYDRHRVSVIVGRGNYPGPGQTWLVMRTVVESVISIVRRLRPDLSEEKLQRLRKLLKAKIPKLTPEGAGGIIPNITTGRVANRFDFMGQNYSVDAACASTLIATEIAVRNLLTGVDDMSLVGGLHICSQVPFLSIFKVTRATSLSSVVRPFDENADGTLAGEGVGMLVLKRLADAERDGDRIYAVIKGVGSASDGRAKSVLAPRVEGEILAIRRALEMADVPSETIGLVECHGTATVVGDSTEIQALEAAYGSAGVHGPSCAIGSVKSMIGHTMPAAGAASLIKTALALYQRVLPPTLNVNRPHARLLDPACRFYVNTETKPWIQRSDGPPRRAGVNAFGFGGINAHVVMEEYTRADETLLSSHLREWPTEVIILQGESRASLLDALTSLREYAVRVEGVTLRDVAYTLNTSLTNLPHRVAIVASSLEELAQKIDRVKVRLSDPSCVQIRERSGIFYFENPELRNGKLALLFPGEGAQYLNMMADLCVHFPEVRKSFDLGDAAVKDAFRTPLSALLYPPPAFSEIDEKAAEERLWSLEHGTETVLTASLGMLALSRSLKIRPDMMTGHSVGDWLALIGSGILDLDEMIGSMDTLDRIYQKLKENITIPKRAMLAVGAGREKILQLARDFDCEVEIANDNCPHQVVAVTDVECARAFAEHLLKSGVFVERLPYDGGYHTPSFTYINEPLLQLFRSYSIKPPTIPVYCGMTAEPWPDDPDAIRTIASSAYSHPILFTQTIERMYDDGARIFIEAGPRGNLTAFVDDILRGKPHLSVPLDVFRRPGLTALNHAIGMLAASHVPMDLTRLYERRDPRKLSLNIGRDSVEPEERQPGVMQVSKVYRYLYPPDGDEFPMPAPVPEPRTVTPEPRGETLRRVAVEPGAEPAWSAGVQQTEAVLVGAGSLSGSDTAGPIPSPNLSGEFSFPGGVNVATSFLEDHFRLMEEFLRTEEEIMSQVLGASAGSQASTATSSPRTTTVLAPTAFAPNGHAPRLPEPAQAARTSVVQEQTGAPSSVREQHHAAAVLAPRKLLLQVVSDRTGYPAEMLDLDQDMEADLGIDSIKRVEIFGALQQLGNGAVLAGEGDMEAIGKVKTLRQILALIENNSSPSPPILSGSPKRAATGSLLKRAEVREHVAGKSLVLRLMLDLDEHRYLRDHSLTFPATECNNQGNRIYKMPLTGSVELACEAAAILIPDRIVVSVSGIDIFRALQVVDGEPPPAVELVATTKGPAEIHVQIRQENGKAYSQATVRLGLEFPEAPPPLEVALENARPANCSGAEIYSKRHMFHGPSFHGVRNIDAMADNGILATLEVLPRNGLIRSDSTPDFHIDPFLFDAAGQLVGYWPIENCRRGGNVLPVKVSRIDRYCDNPGPGTIISCRVAIRNLSEQSLRADFDVLLPDGRVWFRVTGWEDWRLYWPQRLFDYAYGRFAEFQFAGLPVASSELEAAGIDCMLLPPLAQYERDPLLDESWSFVLFSRRELAHFRALAPHKQYESLVTATTTKDAARAQVMRKSGRRVFPADVEIESEGLRFASNQGRPEPLSELRVSCFYKDGWSVAAAGNQINAVSAINADAAVPAAYFTPDEEERLSRLTSPDEWRRRAVIAKQATGKFLRPDAGEEFWQTLLITGVDLKNGAITIADPSSAVNAEDVLRVITIRHSDYFIAVAFQS
jgi:acyl transferase domain-containing protein